MTVAHRGPVGKLVGRRRPAFLAAIACCIASTGCQVDAPTSATTEPTPALSRAVAGMAVPGQYIVTLRSSVEDVPGATAQLVRQANAKLGHTYGTAIKGFSATMSEQAASALADNPNVASVEPDRIVEGYGDIQSPAPWATDRIDQRYLPLSGSYSYDQTGAGVNVYILDTGILTTHTQFEGRASSVFSAFADGLGGTDCHGHGTLVAGLVGSTVYGVAKAARLLSVRVLDCSNAGTASSVIAGLDWVASNRVLPAVANLSFGLAYSATVNQAVNNVINAGVTVTAAAGNAGLDACQISPASVAGAITVGGSTNTMDAMGSWSNRGSCVDLFAPGADVASTAKNGYVGIFNSSTSASAALAAGAAALKLGANPSASPSAVANALISDATTGALTGLDAASPDRLLYTGSGGSTTPPPPPPPPPPTEPVDNAPTASVTVSCRKTVCNFDGSKSADDKGIVRYEWAFGDGSTGQTTGPTTSHTYAVTSSYTVVLTVWDAANQKGTATATVRLKGR